ncbi:hypothetical protein KM043_009976 [Ampulex compressa]|nr:hypothetical protein KM043_009976 [Ampulex compressa]
MQFWSWWYAFYSLSSLFTSSCTLLVGATNIRRKIPARGDQAGSVFACPVFWSPVYPYVCVLAATCRGREVAACQFYLGDLHTRKFSDLNPACWRGGTKKCRNEAPVRAPKVLNMRCNRGKDEWEMRKTAARRKRAQGPSVLRHVRNLDFELGRRTLRSAACFVRSGGGGGCTWVRRTTHLPFRHVYGLDFDLAPPPTLDQEDR